MPSITQTAPLDFLGAAVRVLASADGFGLVHMDMPPGEMPPLHVHHEDDEGFYVLDGELTLFLPGRSETLRAGDFLLAPRGVPHAYEVGAEGARVLVTSTPGGFERFVTEVAALDEVDPATLTEVAAAHAIEILGPPGARP